MPAVTKYYTIPYTGPCTDALQFNREICLGARFDCTPTGKNLVAPCGQTYCDTMAKNELPYFMAYVAGDKLQLQFRLDDNYNDNPAYPGLGWGSFVKATLYGPMGTVLSTDYTDFTSRAIVGWDGTTSYQILELDTALIHAMGARCFSVMVTSYSYFQPEDEEEEPVIAVAQEYCSQLWGEIVCDTAVTLEAIYDKYDCFNNWYGAPVAKVGDNFKYSNKLTFKGYLRNSGGSVQREYTDDNNVKSIVTMQLWKLILKGPLLLVPAYVKDLLILQMFAGSKDLIDGEEYLCEKCEPTPEGHMFRCEIEVYRICKSNATNCQ